MGRKWVYIVAVILFIAYASIMIWPYLRSTIVRDASVTTWSRSAVAPIAGRIISELPETGSAIGLDGLVAIVRNNLLLQQAQAVEDTRDKAVAAETQIKEAKDYLAALRKLESGRIAVRDRNGEAFMAQLDTRITNLHREMNINSDRLDVLQRISDRQQSLVFRGAGSDAAMDEVLLRLSESHSRRAELQASLEFAELRRRFAEEGVYIDEDGSTPEWIRYGELDLQLEMQQAEHRLHGAEVELQKAQKDYEVEQATLTELREARVLAPPGSLVFSVLVSPDDTVVPGERIIEWIDCDFLLVDVPVSDAELPLIQKGSLAHVILEGERTTREAKVLLTRGSSAVLERVDLVATAKGRTPGVAQVLLKLDADPLEFEQCPVGRAAYVDFPGIGLLDVLRARLRL
jgi:HlyD family secretion protein